MIFLHLIAPDYNTNTNKYCGCTDQEEPQLDVQYYKRLC